MNKKFEITIDSSHLESFHSTNGMVDEDNVRFAKQTLLFDAIRNHINMVDEVRLYPENDKMTIKLALDITILSRARYNELLAYETRYKELCN